MLAGLRDRAERAERERDSQARIAVVEERTRIAREVHDVVSHNLSVMTALADGAGSATVALGWTGEELTVTVRDDGSGALPQPVQVGHGLVGMRERVGSHGG